MMIDLYTGLRLNQAKRKCCAIINCAENCKKKIQLVERDKYIRCTRIDFSILILIWHYEIKSLCKAKKRDVSKLSI